MSPEGPAGPSAFWKLSNEINPEFSGTYILSSFVFMMRN
jgi:hypothetical protein